MLLTNKFVLFFICGKCGGVDVCIETQIVNRKLCVKVSEINHFSQTKLFSAEKGSLKIKSITCNNVKKVFEIGNQN